VAFNDRLNVAIEGFLRLLSGRFATAAAARCLEYLIRRFKIHVYNVEAAVTCALPYHATAEFVKLVQLANLENTSFYWLKGVKEKGAAPPRDGLVARCARDGAFLSFVCEAAAASASAKVRHKCFFVRGHVFFFFRRRSCSVGVVSQNHRTTTHEDSRFLSSRRRFRASQRHSTGPPPFLPSDAAALVR